MTWNSERTLRRHTSRRAHLCVAPAPPPAAAPPAALYHCPSTTPSAVLHHVIDLAFRMSPLRVLVVVVVAAVLQKGAAVQVTLRQGVLRGEDLKVDEGRRVFSFRGIPYARPPVGDLRFMEPEPAEAWEGTRESFNPPQCPQLDLEAMLKGGEPDVGGEEDCLYLHVYTPKVCGDELLPVMVFIHGGGFVLGSPDFAGGSPLPLMTRDVVLVSLQYRLSTLGFLSTGDSFLPGNMGLKDQTLALRWVRDNIRSFGGDPDSVTIFGESAGGASVHYQTLTPKSEGLFHRAIMQSGNALCPWALRGDHKRIAAGVAQQLECKGVEARDGSLDGPALLACLQAATVKDLIMAGTQGETWNNFPMYMVPRVDGDFLPAHPATLLREGRYHRMDVMAGVCQHEGASFVRVTDPMKELATEFPTKGPLSVGVDQEERPVHLARRIYYHHLGGGNITVTDHNMDQFVHMYSNIFFTIPHDLTTHFLARDAPYGSSLYLYQLEHPGEMSFASFVTNNTDERFMKYVSHGNDLMYLFNDVFGMKPLERDDDVFLSDIMLDLWTTFAATGSPTPDLSLGFRWEAATTSSLHYLSLRPAPTMRPDPRAETRPFYTSLPTRANSLLFPDEFNAKTVSAKRDTKSDEDGHCHV